MPREIIGTRNPAATPPKVGTPGRRVDTDGYALLDFAARNVGEGVVSVEKRNGVMTGLRVEHGTVADTGRVLNMPYADAQLDGFVVRDVHGTNIDSFLRLKVARNGLVEDCSGVGADRPLNGFPSGCFTGDGATSNITYRRVRMDGFRQWPIPAGYHNGDGFADEELGSAMRYLQCSAKGNADAGLDTKSEDVEVEEFVAEGNGRNFRLWGSGTLTDCVSKDPRKCHIWAGGASRLGNYTITRPVFIGGSDKPHLQVDAGREGVVITVVDPVLPPGEQLRVVKNETGKLVKVDVVRTPGGPVVPPEPPVVVTPPPPPVEPPVQTPGPILVPEPPDLASEVTRLVRAEVGPVLDALPELARAAARDEVRRILAGLTDGLARD